MFPPVLTATRRLCAFVLVAGFFGAASALAGQASHPDSSHASIIRGITIDPKRIFDSAEATSAFYRGMNALHSTTKPYVIRNQLLFAVGDRWDSATVNETVRNLRSLGLFRRVEIDSIPTDSGVIARVVTQDAWTLGIVFTIKSTGSEIGYAVGINDRNVLGSGTQFQVQYGKNPDRDSVMFGLTRNFVFNTPFNLGANFNLLSDGQTGWFNFGLPFRTLESPTGWTLGGDLYNGRVLLFYGGDTIATDTVRRSYQVLTLNPAIALSASAERYVRLGIYAQVQRSAYQPYDASASLLTDSVSAAFGPYLAIGRPFYRHTRFYTAGGRLEDLSLGVSGTLGAYLAPATWGYHTTGVGASLLVTAGQGQGQFFALESLTVTSLFQHGSLDSGSVYAGVTLAWQPTEVQLLVGYVGVGAQKNGYPGENYDLGFGYALRAFPQHSFTGNRMFITAAEYRWVFIRDFAKLFALGAGVFVDHAGAWYTYPVPGVPVPAERTGTDAGIGLRFSSITGNPGYVMRADAAYRWPTDALAGGWVFTFGKGFVWQVF
jgi:hypothetical protein